jgi:hypothetical protein
MSKEELLVEFYNSLIDTDTVFTGEQVIQALAKYLSKEELKEFLYYLKEEHGL